MYHEVKGTSTGTGAGGFQLPLASACWAPNTLILPFPDSLPPLSVSFSPLLHYPWRSDLAFIPTHITLSFCIDCAASEVPVTDRSLPKPASLVLGPAI